MQDTIAGIQEIRAAHIDVMLMEPQLCRELTGTPGSVRYRDAVRSIAAGMGVPEIRRYDLMRNWLAAGILTPEQMLSPDGLHMADGGYAKLAEVIAEDIVHRTRTARIALSAQTHR